MVSTLPLHQASTLQVDIETEQLLTPREATRHPALRNSNGKPSHLAKVYRLMQVGARAPDGTRRKLGFVRVPGGVRIPASSITRLVEELTSGAGSDSGTVVTTAAARRRQQQVDAELDRAGIA